MLPRDSRKIVICDIRQSHTYEEVWQLQTHLQQKLIKAKRQGITDHPSYLIRCEHKPVYTLGKNGDIDNLLLNESGLKAQGIEFYKINRGGDITYHGPGQLTFYPILDMDYYYHDVHRYVRDLEELIIKTLSRYSIAGIRLKDYTGVWIEDNGQFRKLCAIGVHMSRWVSMHGLALNINTAVDLFSNIIPCGINLRTHSVSSIAFECNEVWPFEQVVQHVTTEFCEVFDCETIESDIYPM